MKRLHEQLRLAQREAAPAAPTAQAEQEPVAWIRKNGFRFIAEIEPQDGSEVPLYAHPQPAPDVAALVEALEMMVEMVEFGGFGRDAAMYTARAALAAHRKQEEQSDE